MAELSTLARPYAEAVFKRAKQTGNTEQWSEELAFLAVLAQDPDIVTIIGNPKVSKDRVMQLLLDICQDHLSEEAKNLLKLLVENRRLHLSAKISDLYAEKVAADAGYVNVQLFSPYALTKAEQKKYGDMLEKYLHKTVHTQVVVDKSLLGGILAKAGDKVLDGSIKGQIHQLAKRL